MEIPKSKDHCPKCFRRVTARQEALQCYTCGCWMHRTCGTDMSQATYREITRQIKSGIPFDWICGSCSESVASADAEDAAQGDVTVGVDVETDNEQLEEEPVSKKPKTQTYTSITSRSMSLAKFATTFRYHCRRQYKLGPPYIYVL